MNKDINTICFLCKQDLDVTEEHVFPKWLQHDYNLWDQFMILRNGTKFRYRNIKVPCCSTCNGIYLSEIENKISKAIRKGDVDILKENSDITFIWLYKIMYGLHYKEIFLKENIKNPHSGTIAPKEHFLIHNSRNIFPFFVLGKLCFEGFKPYSLFVFSLSEPHPNNYFYVDEPDMMFTSIVIGKIGIICSFQCDGYIEQDIKNKAFPSELEELSLAEFADLSSFVLSLKSRMKMLPNYLVKIINNKMHFQSQESSAEDRYEEFNIKFMFEMFQKCYSSFFKKQITADFGEEKILEYKSPFIYF